MRTQMTTKKTANPKNTGYFFGEIKVSYQTKEKPFYQIKCSADAALYFRQKWDIDQIEYRESLLFVRGSMLHVWASIMLKQS